MKLSFFKRKDERIKTWEDVTNPAEINGKRINRKHICLCIEKSMKLLETKMSKQTNYSNKIIISNIEEEEKKENRNERIFRIEKEISKKNSWRAARLCQKINTWKRLNMKKTLNFFMTLNFEAKSKMMMKIFGLI